MKIIVFNDFNSKKLLVSFFEWFSRYAENIFLKSIRISSISELIKSINLSGIILMNNFSKFFRNA